MKDENGGPTLQDLDAKLSADSRVRRKSWVNTARGRELRVVSLIPAGSPVEEQTYTPEGSSPTITHPDLLVAVAIFQADGRLYQVTSGSSLLSAFGKSADIKASIKSAQESLDALLAGLVILPSGTLH